MGGVVHEIRGLVSFFSMIREISLYFKNSFNWGEVFFFFEYMSKKSFVFPWFLIFFYMVEHGFLW